MVGQKVETVGYTDMEHMISVLLADAYNIALYLQHLGEKRYSKCAIEEVVIYKLLDLGTCSSRYYITHL